jgi:hypothetical protein
MRLAAAIVSAFVTSASVAAAASFSFTAVVQNGPRAGETGFGLIDVDLAPYLGLSIVNLSPEDGLTVSLNLFGEDFTQDDDARGLTFRPLVTFVPFKGGDLVPIALDFEIDDVADPAIAGFKPKITQLWFGTNPPPLKLEYVWQVEVTYATTPIPLPATAWLALSGFAALAAAARRRAA